MTDLVRLPGASALSHWLLLPLLSQGGGLVAVTRALLAATGAVQHPDLHLNVTVTPESVTMVVMVVMVMSTALIMLVVMVVMMVMDLLSGLLPHRGHVSPRALLCNNHPRTRVNPLHPERKRRETVVHHTKPTHLAVLESCLSIPLLESCLSIPLLESCLSILDRESCLLSVKTKIRL